MDLFMAPIKKTQYGILREGKLLTRMSSNHVRVTGCSAFTRETIEEVSAYMTTGDILVTITWEE
jgi:hypothetical protein